MFFGLHPGGERKKKRGKVLPLISEEKFFVANEKKCKIRVASCFREYLSRVGVFGGAEKSSSVCVWRGLLPLVCGAGWVECVKRGLSRSVVCTGRHLCQLLRVFPLTFFCVCVPGPTRKLVYGKRINREKATAQIVYTWSHRSSYTEVGQSWRFVTGKKGRIKLSSGEKCN